jgi:hypothetical protein
MNEIVLASALSLVTALILVVVSLYVRMGRLGERLDRGQGEIRVALLGFEGSGGIIKRLDRVEGSVATVDERIATSRHAAMNQMQTRLSEMEDRILARIEESDRRVKEEIDELKERRRS